MAARRDVIEGAFFPPACGAYVVWEPGRIDRPLYVGVAATQTLQERWQRQHLRLRAGGSALRRTLGVHLGLVDRKLNVRRDGRFYPPEVEERISSFLRSCEIEFHVAASAEDARRLESKLIRDLRPLLNVRGGAATTWATEGVEAGLDERQEET